MYLAHERASWSRGNSIGRHVQSLQCISGGIHRNAFGNNCILADPSSPPENQYCSACCASAPLVPGTLGERRRVLPFPSFLARTNGIPVFPVIHILSNPGCRAVRFNRSRYFSCPCPNDDMATTASGHCSAC